MSYARPNPTNFNNTKHLLHPYRPIYLFSNSTSLHPNKFQNKHALRSYRTYRFQQLWSIYSKVVREHPKLMLFIWNSGRNNAVAPLTESPSRTASNSDRIAWPNRVKSSVPMVAFWRRSSIWSVGGERGELDTKIVQVIRVEIKSSPYKALATCYCIISTKLGGWIGMSWYLYIGPVMDGEHGWPSPIWSALVQLNV